MRVILLWKEATGAQDHAVQPLFEIVEPAQPLGGEFRHSVDVPRRERPQALVDPHGGEACFLPDFL
jgi:hypothetical protein